MMDKSKKRKVSEGNRMVNATWTDLFVDVLLSPQVWLVRACSELQMEWCRKPSQTGQTSGRTMEFHPWDFREHEKGLHLGSWQSSNTVCEQLFSHLNYINKHRSRLTDDSLQWRWRWRLTALEQRSHHPGKINIWIGYCFAYVQLIARSRWNDGLHFGLLRVDNLSLDLYFLNMTRTQIFYVKVSIHFSSAAVCWSHKCNTL